MTYRTFQELLAEAERASGGEIKTGHFEVKSTGESKKLEDILFGGAAKVLGVMFCLPEEIFKRVVNRVPPDGLIVLHKAENNTSRYYLPRIESGRIKFWWGLEFEKARKSSLMELFVFSADFSKVSAELIEFGFGLLAEEKERTDFETRGGVLRSINPPIQVRFGQHSMEKWVPEVILGEFFS